MNTEAQLQRITSAPLLVESEGDGYEGAIFPTTEATSDALNLLMSRIETAFPNLPGSLAWIVADLAMVAALSRLSAEDALGLAASPEAMAALEAMAGAAATGVPS